MFLLARVLWSKWWNAEVGKRRQALFLRFKQEPQCHLLPLDLFSSLP